MLDLIILTQSVQSASDVSDGSKLYCEGMVSVLILPALPPVHLKFINEKTSFYKVCRVELFFSHVNFGFSLLVTLLDTLF
jgi:hypothetical protein